MEKITHNLRYYRSRIVKEIFKLINVLADNKIQQSIRMVKEFLHLMKIHIDFDKEYIINKLSNYVQSSYIPYLQQNIKELEVKIKSVTDNQITDKELQEIIELSSEHFPFCSILDFSLSVLPYNIADEVVEELKKSHKILFEK